jgi:hypothetical protein
MTRKIGQRTTTGKVRSGWQTTTASSIRDREEDVVFDEGHMVQFCCESYDMLFLVGVLGFECGGVLLEYT